MTAVFVTFTRAYLELLDVVRSHIVPLIWFLAHWILKRSGSFMLQQQVSNIYIGSEPFIHDTCTVHHSDFLFLDILEANVRSRGMMQLVLLPPDLFVSVRILAETILWISSRFWISRSKVTELHYSCVQREKKNKQEKKIKLLSSFCAECMVYGLMHTAALILMMSQSAAWRCCRVGCHVCTKTEPSPSRYSPHGQMHLMETPTHSPVALPTWERHLVDLRCNYSHTSLLPSPWPALLDT